MTTKAEDWCWSSAAAHCGSVEADLWVTMDVWRNRWDAAGWRDYLEAGQSQRSVAAIRHNTHTGRPLGSTEFMHQVEGQTKRRLIPQKRGPKPQSEPEERQGTFSFGA
jgi:putative transposase